MYLVTVAFTHGTKSCKTYVQNYSFKYFMCVVKICCWEKEQFKYLKVKKWPVLKRKSNNWGNAMLLKKLQKLGTVLTGAL